MISLGEALERINDALSPLESEAVALRECAGRTLAAPVVARRTQPPFNASAMDGYAVRAGDLHGAQTRLRLGGESAAGHASSRALAPGEAMRISTGAPMPDGADQVVIQENAILEGDAVILSGSADPGRNVRLAGLDFREGDNLLPAGTRLGAAHIALIAGAGVIEVEVTRRPQVGILSTGDELVEPGEASRPDQIMNSLAPALEALVEEWGGRPVYLGIARDNPESVRDRLAATEGLDLLVTIGGASVGDHDHLRRVFAEEGGELVFEKIAVKPGKPTWFGRLGTCWTLGLPGNPVSALVMAQLCLSAAMDAVCGRRGALRFRTAPLGAPLPANGPRENFVRARIDLETGAVHPLGNQDSSAMSALAASTCLIRRASQAAASQAGAPVEILPLGTG